MGDASGDETRPVCAVHIEPSAGSEPVWQGLRHAWFAQRVVLEGADHAGCGYAWDLPRYHPVFVVGEDGRPLLAFASTGDDS